MSKEERKKEIQKAAMKKFLEKGFNNTTMEDVIESTSMSKGGVYHYYKNTTDILHDIMSEGNNYRAKVISEFLKDKELKSKEEVFSEIITEKMVDGNEFMPLYVMFLQETQRDEKLKELFTELKEEVLGFSYYFGKDLNLDDKNSISSEFIIAFINSIILGSEILGAREIFSENKNILQEMIKVYLRLYKENE